MMKTALRLLSFGGCAGLTVFLGAPWAWGTGMNCGRVVGLNTDIWRGDGIFTVSLSDSSSYSSPYTVDYFDQGISNLMYASLLAAKTAELNVCLDVNSYDEVNSIIVDGTTP